MNSSTSSPWWTRQKNWRWWRRRAINLHGWRQRLYELFIDHGIDEPHNTSLLLLSTAISKPKSWILAHSNVQPTPEQATKIITLSKRVASGHPLPYVLGEWEFFGRPFKVTPDVLIPRPETESLVEMAIGHARECKAPMLIDVGTGSGAIAVSLAAELPGAQVVASDISWPALGIAQENALRHAQPGILFIQADLILPLRTKFDVICANLPYIPTEKLDGLQVAQWEPPLALDGGESGLDAITPLLEQARDRLSPKGVILLEIESSLGEGSLAASKAAFPDARVRLIQDMAGLDRIIEISRS